MLGFYAEQLGLPARRLELLALAKVGGEGEDIGAIFGLQPFEDDRGVEPARIGEHDAFDLWFLWAWHGLRRFLQETVPVKAACDPAIHAAPPRNRNSSAERTKGRAARTWPRSPRMETRGWPGQARP